MTGERFIPLAADIHGVDTVNKATRSRMMSRIRGKHTGPEVKLRRALRKAGYRYRLHYGKHKIDIAFPDKRVAVFVDGCFWHRCPYHYIEPKSNRGFWLPKIRHNQARDREVNREMKQQGWTVIRVWEHELRVASDRAARRVMKTLGKP